MSLETFERGLRMWAWVPTSAPAGGAMISAASISTAETGAVLVAEGALSSNFAPASASPASGFLPVTDCTNAIVCAIRRSRSFFQLITHLSRIYSRKGRVGNQGRAAGFGRQAIRLMAGVI